MVVPCKRETLGTMTDKIKLRYYGVRLNKRVRWLISLIIEISIGDGFVFKKDTNLLLTKNVILSLSGSGDANGYIANLVGVRTIRA